MAKKQCSDCRYVNGLGYDFWCDKGHTECKVFSGETNCPYYKYHDWSKGAPNKIKNCPYHRFKLDSEKGFIDTQKRGANTMTPFEVLVQLNKLNEENKQLKQQLQKIQDSFEVSWTQNYIEFDQDKLYIKDNNTEIRLDGTNLFIEVYIPHIDEYCRFRYIVSGRSNIMREFIKDYNSGDDE